LYWKIQLLKTDSSYNKVTHHLFEPFCHWFEDEIFWFLWVVKIKIENTVDINRLAYHPSYIPVLSVLPCHKNDELNYTLKHVLHFCYLYLNCNNIFTLHKFIMKEMRNVDCSSRPCYPRQSKYTTGSCHGRYCEEKYITSFRRVGGFWASRGMSCAHVKSNHIGSITALSRHPNCLSIHMIYEKINNWYYIQNSHV
jgi:hypothetical protein